MKAGKTALLRTMLWLLCPVCAFAGGKREKTSIDFDWKFILNSDNPENAAPETPTTEWDDVQLPHDWSISLPFDLSLSGSCGHLPGGVGWYRKNIEINADDKGKLVSVLFDGIYSRSDVYVNGRHLGFRPYGFCFIEYDLTPYLNYGGDNIIAVRVNNPTHSDSIARWYTGAGIYRHAWLVKTSDVHVKTYGTYVTTPVITDDGTVVSVQTAVANETPCGKTVAISQKIADAEGNVLTQTKKEGISISGNGEYVAEQELRIDNPRLWSPEEPNLYTLYTTVYEGDEEKDIYETVFGVRSCVFTPDSGFVLNGRRLKLKGFCLHQDDASLGTALPLRSMERKLEIIKDYGVNAVRCSHNQPAPEFLDLCDRLGFIVIDEAFDKWKSGYYAEYFDEWWQEDLKNMLVRDRNHPCVALWSIGNELQEAYSDNPGCSRAKMLQDFVHEFEPTRQVCLAAQNNHNASFAGVTDVIGYNYLEARMLSDHRDYPERCFVVTEELPYYCGAEGNIRSYDTNNPWNIIEENDFIAGGFIWVGTDYIGEAVETSHGWPNGLFDVCMNEKARAAFHRAVWNTEPFISIAVRDNSLIGDYGRDLWQWPPIASTWNLPESYKGLVLEVQTITNCEKATLFLNGKVMGTKNTNEYPNHTISWFVPYTPGSIWVKGINGADTVASYALHTAGEAAKLAILPDRTELKADGQDLSYIKVELRDSNDVLVPDDDRIIRTKVEGEGRLIGFISSNLRRSAPFTSHSDATLYGRAMAIVQTTRREGKITVKFQAEGLQEPATVELNARKAP